MTSGTWIPVWLFVLHPYICSPPKYSRGLPLITYEPRVRGGNVSIHYHCVSYAKRGGGSQIACKIAYVFSGRPLIFIIY